MRTSTIPIAFLCFAFAACAPEEGPDLSQLDEAVASLGQPIQGGYKDDTDTAVVGLVRLNNFGISGCTGSLIAPNVVLTAQHCVAPTTGNGGVLCGTTKFGVPYKASSLYVTTKSQFTQNPNDYHRTREIIIPPGTSDFCGRDIAIIVLEKPIDPSEAVPYVPRVDSSLETGDEYYAIGNGQIYDGGPSGRRYRRDGLFTQCVGAACPQVIIKETEWRGDTGICQGDSGGPALDLQNRVTGIASRGAAGCESPTYGHVFGWGDWIKDVTLYATSSASIEAPPWAQGWPTDPAFNHPVGEACGGPEQCPSNACIDGHCTRLCNEQAPCPQGYECSPDENVCRKIPEPVVNDDDDDDDTVVEASCSIASRTIGASRSSGAPMDPTKPIPWPIVGMALAVALRRKRAR